MFITKEEIKKELLEEDAWKALTPKEKEMFLIYCTNGHEEVEAYKDVYVKEDSDKVVKFPGKKAANIISKDEFQECFEVYAEILRDAVSMRTNAHLFNLYYMLSTYNILDYVDEIGAFKFKSIEEAKEILGLKALAIVGLDVTMHPKDPTKVITVPKLADRAKNMKELSKFSKFFGSEEAGGTGMGSVQLNTTMPGFDKDSDAKNREKYGLA